MNTLDAVEGTVQSTTPVTDEMMTVAEAAKRLNVHEKTLRRWIRTGRVQADLVDGPYGPQYQVPVAALSTAQQVLDVVKVERPTDPMTLALAVAQAVHREHELLRAQLQEELGQFKAELLAALSAQTLTPTEPTPPPALIPPMEQPRRRWWPFASKP